jgi:leukotriene-A4 hydrolase
LSPFFCSQSLDLAVDFPTSTIAATAAWTLAVLDPTSTEAAFDTRGLTIKSVTVDGTGVAPTLDPPHPTLGARLRVPLPSPLGDTVTVTIQYATGDDAPAIQWLSPAMTAGGARPFLFTQCQAIHARSLLPCQDTPGVKFTYDARVTVPAGLTAVMSALREEEGEGGGAADGGAAGGAAATTTFRFRQPIPLSSYLLALAVGDIAAAPLSDRIAVWAEPATLPRAAATFAEADAFLAAVERVAGAPYRWGRADMLVLPPSFPYGGMENPCATFLTPTLLGPPGAPIDTRPASVVAHELAHSVFGNDVSCATWADFFLNEGWCVWW